MSELDMTGIETPIVLSSIPKFETQNPSISINVLVYEGKKLIPVYTSKFCNQRPHHVNLLLLSKGDKFHYTLLKSISRLVGDRTHYNGKTFVCPCCLHPFSLEHCLQNHLPKCSQHPAQTVKYPEEGKNILKFHKIQHMFPVPFALYADFESFITPSGEHVSRELMGLYDHHGGLHATFTPHETKLTSTDLKPSLRQLLRRLWRRLYQVPKLDYTPNPNPNPISNHNLK